MLKGVLSHWMLYIFYKISLDCFFAFGSSEKYMYLGLQLDFVLGKYIIGWIFYLFLLFFKQFLMKEEIRFIFNMLMILSTTATISLYGLMNFRSAHFLLVVLFWLGVLLAFFSLQKCWATPIRLKSFNSLSRQKKPLTMNKEAVLDTIIFVSAGIITLYMFTKYGKVLASSILHVYDLRSEFRSLNVSQLDTYLISWNGLVLLPWSFLRFLSKRKWVMALIVFQLGFVMFSINGMKTWLFIYPAFIVIFYILKRRDYSYLCCTVLIGISVLLFSSLIIYRTSGEYWLLSICERIFFTPAENDYYYIEYSSKHEILFLRESIMKNLFESPYEISFSKIIGDMYLSAATYRNATNGGIGDAYANFGVLGILVYPWLMAITFRLVGKKLQYFPDSVFGCVIFSLVFTYIGTSFFTWLMTGGVLLYYFIMWIYNRASFCKKIENFDNKRCLSRHPKFTKLDIREIIEDR